MRLRLFSTVDRRRALGALLLCGLASGSVFLTNAAAQQQRRSASRQIAFYGDLGNSINGPIKNPLVVRPPSLDLTEDGSVALVELRWTGWGSSVAHAEGVFSASNCKPNCAQGELTRHPAQVTLSSPGVVFGHTVYRCFRLTVPASRKSNQQMCLGPLPGGGSQYGYVVGATKPVPPGKPPSPTTTGATFLTPLPGHVGCQISVSATFTQVFCQASGPHNRAALAHGATLKATGLYSTCGATCVGNPGEGTPTYPVGKTVTVRPFTCTVKPDGVQCVVTATGKGFLFNEDSVTAVP